LKETSEGHVVQSLVQSGGSFTVSSGCQ